MQRSVKGSYDNEVETGHRCSWDNDEAGTAGSAVRTEKASEKCVKKKKKESDICVIIHVEKWTRVMWPWILWFIFLILLCCVM